MSTPTDVQQFLDDLKTANPEKHALFQKLRHTILTQKSGIEERIIYGGIMFSLEKDFSGIFPQTHHISLEFGRGYLFDDPEKMLEGSGKFRRHLKIRTAEDITTKNVMAFITQALSQ